MQTKLVQFRRLNDQDTGYFEIKDPSVVTMPDGSYLMYASLGTSLTQEWVIGRFQADHPGGPWQELEPVRLTGVAGPEVCAPAVVLEQKDGKPLFKMYVQTTCFQENGVIALATSADGLNFSGASHPALTKEDIPKGSLPVISLYDVAISDLELQGKPYECMIVSGYRRIGCGDIYLSLREKTLPESAWGTPVLALAQENVPFHNRPDSKNFEWGLEGAKLIQLAPDAFLMIGVCFLEKSKTQAGTRQRVFLAAAAAPAGPFLPMNMPIEPTAYENGTGENGHPDTIDLGPRMGILYQERAGDGKPWHLRYTEADKKDLLRQVRDRLAAPAAQARRFDP